VERGKCDVNRIPLDCTATWKLISSGCTVGVFQLEKKLGQDWARRIKPRNIEELADLISILRPGSLDSGMSEDYATIKAGKKEPVYIHPALKPILAPTLGCLIYQEQAIRIAVELAGFSLAQGDDLRKGVAKKSIELIAALKSQFVEGCVKKGLVTRPQAEEIFGWIEKFQRYGFNRCVSGGTIIRRNGKNSHMKEGLTVREMYRIRHDQEYAKVTGHEQLRRKWKRLGHYGYGLSLCKDGRVRQNIIRDLQPAGSRQVFRITIDNGAHVDVTDNHKFPTQEGERELREMAVGDSLYVCEGYERSNEKRYNYSAQKQQPKGKTYRARCGFPAGEANPGFTNGGFTKFKQFRAATPDICAHCQSTRGRIETHHRDGNHENNCWSNLVKLCASCHKKHEYAAGRIRRGQKGYPATLVHVVSIEPIGETDVWDVTMDGPDHNFVVESGLVTSNSHAVSYGMVGYQTAWLKAHFPMEFYTSYLTYSAYKGDSTEEVYKLVQDARLFGIGILPPDIRRGNAHFEMTAEGIAFGLVHIRGVGTSAIEKIGKVLGRPGGYDGSLKTWPQFVLVATELPRNVAEGLIKAGAVDWTGMPRTQMLAELEAILGTSTRNEVGEKVEIKGLTERELEFFLTHFGESGSTQKTLELMASAGPNEGAKSLSQMSKPELLDLLKQLGEAESGQKCTIKALKEAIQAKGWRPPKKAVANAARREIIAAKTETLAKEFKDTNTGNAHAERYFLGISLTCSPADDADNSMATATCLDIARSPNDRSMSAVCIIDQVRHTRTKRGKNPGAPMCFLQISDSTYSLDTVVFPDTYEKVKHLCREDAIVMIYGHKRDGSFLVQDMKKLL
jgi:DNA polymerase III alpha subunit